MNIGIFDLEMSNLNADYGIVLCGVVKPYKGKAISARIDQFPLYKKDRSSDKALILELRKMLGGFDILVSYNGKCFDIPFLNARLLSHGLERLPQTKHIDVYWQARYKLKLSSSRLEAVQEFLGLEVKKTRIDGRHWTRAVSGYKGDLDYIVDHCKLDVAVLEQVYDAMRPYIDVIHS